MTPQVLLQHFDRIGEAPEGITRLRRFILDLAVRGKLVEQDPRDVPASELFKRIQAEKLRFVKDGIFREQKPLPPIEEDETDYVLPASWEWVRMGDVIKLWNGYAFKSGDFQSNGIPVIRIGDLQGGKVVLDGAVRISEAIADAVGPEFNIPNDALLIAMSGATTGKVAFNRTGVRLLLNQRVGRIEVFLMSPDFIRFFFETIVVKNLSISFGTAIPNLSAQQINQTIVPLPPLAEQHRIVAKVDELMGLCDRLEAAQMERESRRDRLVASSLHHLNNGADADAFREHARFYFNHLPRLTTRLDHIKQLRQTILNLAVRGKLVEQDPTDEPVSELLKDIQIEKEKLAKDGGLKKDKIAWIGLPEEPPHNLPQNWKWTRIQDLFEISRGGSPRPAGDPRYFGGPIPWITVREITKDQEKYLANTETGLTEEGATRSRFINPGDLLLTNSGATLGVPKISRIRACMNDGVAVLRLFHSVPLNNFAYLYLYSQTEAFRRVNQGMGQPNLNTQIIAGWFFPLPPLAEQHRIVAKVDELMALCDQLETQLTTTQSESRHLLEAVLHHALSA